jgi:tRNA nucleotidyltransferase/poly(A) polymerase
MKLNKFGTITETQDGDIRFQHFNIDGEGDTVIENMTVILARLSIERLESEIEKLLQGATRASH